MTERLIGVDLDSVIDQIVQLVHDPASNVTASLLLAAALAVFLLIITIAVVLVVLRRSEVREARRARVVAAQQNSADTVGGPRVSAIEMRLRFSVLVLAVAALLWVATGVSTGSDDACVPCHETSIHVSSQAGTAHSDVRCVRCHEPGGVLYSATLAVPSRLGHLAGGLRESGSVGEYGHVASSACRDCHARDIEDTVVNEVRGIKVSHREPVDAGAACLDCHRLGEAGDVSGAYGGMASCLRCHDARTVSNECDLCHTKDIGYPSVAEALPSPETARTLVSDPRAACYECHEPKRCDACHGVRLPHGKEFVEDHAYEGARSLWAGSAGKCVPCHNEDRRGCSSTGCHGPDFPYHYGIDKDFARTHATGRWVRSGGNRVIPSNLGCATCHRGDVCTAMCHEYREPLPQSLVLPPPPEDEEE